MGNPRVHVKCSAVAVDVPLLDEFPHKPMDVARGSNQPIAVLGKLGLGFVGLIGFPQGNSGLHVLKRHCSLVKNIILSQPLAIN